MFHETQFENKTSVTTYNENQCFLKLCAEKLNYLLSKIKQNHQW